MVSRHVVSSPKPLKLNAHPHITDLMTGRGEYKPPPGLRAPPSLLGSSTATAKLEVPLVRNCSEASTRRTIQCPLQWPWALLGFVRS
jgi:hypothetical protein